MVYIIKSTIILGIILAVYHLFLEKEKMHRFNRFYLLSGLLLVFGTPLITIETISPIAASSSVVTMAPMVIEQAQSEIIYETAKGINWMQFILYGYGIITMIMLLRFLNNIGLLLLKIRNNKVIDYRGRKIVLLQESTLPHTFLQYVFINEVDFESDKIQDELFIHEFTHADQWHSLDIILIELIQVFAWFNPLIYVYKKAIQLNHEFLADAVVVSSIDEVPAYQNLLLSKASNNEQVYLASNLNFSVTKKRLRMMTKPISKRRNIIYGMMLFPMAVLLVSCFAEYENIQIRPSGENYIDYVGDDRISVNLIGMNESQLDEVQTQLTQVGIDLNYINRDFDSEGIIERIEFEVFFPNGNSGKAKADYTTYGDNRHGFGGYFEFWRNFHRFIWRSV